MRIPSFVTAKGVCWFLLTNYKFKKNPEVGKTKVVDSFLMKLATFYFNM